MDLNELKERLTALKQRGYVVSMRRGNTGIGYTLETLLEVSENNLRLPDLGTMELKAHRQGTTSRITLFTFNRGVWKIHPRDVIERYGYVDTNGRHSLYCMASSLPNNQGLYTRVGNRKLTLHHIDGTAIAEWLGQTLIERFICKMPSLVFVQADVRENSDDREEFWFNEAHLLTNPNEDNFLDLIRNDRVAIDMRMHLRQNGVVRNHGTAFRVEERYLRLCFGNRESLV